MVYLQYYLHRKLLLWRSEMCVLMPRVLDSEVSILLSKCYIGIRSLLAVDLDSQPEFKTALSALTP